MFPEISLTISVFQILFEDEDNFGIDTFAACGTTNTAPDSQFFKE